MPKRRVLSDFLCRELLYDYVTGLLDAERSRAVEECLSDSEDVRDDLRALKEGLKYCQSLKNTKISQPLFEKLQQPPKGYKDYLKAWKALPTPIRIGIESLIVAVLVGVVVTFIPKQYAPWSKSSSYSLIEINREDQVANTEFEMTTEVSTTTTLLIAKQTTTTLQSSTTVTTFGPPTTLAKPGLAQSIFKMFIAPSPIPTTTLVAAKESSAVVSQVTSTSLIATKGKGEIYRVYMSSNQVDEVTPRMVEKILALGGEKAGEVQLGWRRQQGSYFHFSLPESNFDQLKSFLQNFGPVRIVKEPHGRVMPPGTIRLILWLETTKNKDSATETNDNKGPQEDSP